MFSRFLAASQITLQWIGWGLVLPFRFVLMVRRATTEASVSLLLIVIVSLNIVWGYPWTGMFAASLTMLVGGFIASTVFRPRAELDVSLPQVALVGEPFAAEVHINHRGPFPAFDVTVDRIVSRFSTRTPVEICGPGVPLASLSPNEWTSSRLMMICQNRGIHTLPPVRLLSTFPFCLFQSEQRTQMGSEIVVAPQPFPEDGDMKNSQFFAQIDRWALAWFGGDSFDYAGSREYVVGMPVRRWDFRSWARLGRPIVREFQSPSRQIANLIVDTGTAQKLKTSETNESFELMLRYVATAIEICNRDGIGTQLYVSSESIEQLVDRLEQDTTEHSLVMLPLATAKTTESQIANERIQKTFEGFFSGPTLVFTTRDLSTEFGLSLPSQATLIRIDQQQVSFSAQDNFETPDITWPSSAAAEKPFTSSAELPS